MPQLRIKRTGIYACVIEIPPDSAASTAHSWYKHSDRLGEVLQHLINQRYYVVLQLDNFF